MFGLTGSQGNHGEDVKDGINNYVVHGREDAVNPPVEAWAAWQIYTLEQKYWARKDKDFLERIFQKLLLNFTWWVNREDAAGKNVFEGGFLGLDNIGIFDRSSEPTEPSDAFLSKS